MNSRQVIVCLYLLLIAGLGAGGGYLLLKAHAEYSRIEQVEALNRQRLAEVQGQLRIQEKVLERLRSDPAFVDEVIRKKLGYAKPDEFVFRFPD